MATFRLVVAVSVETGKHVDENVLRKAVGDAVEFALPLRFALEKKDVIAVVDEVEQTS